MSRVQEEKKALVGSSIFKVLHRKRAPTRYAYVLPVFGKSSYLLGALACAHSIRKTAPSSDLVLMVTEDISPGMIMLAYKIFDVVIQMPYLGAHTIALRTQKQQSMYQAWKNVAFTKWNCLGLVEYEKVMLVDADKIVLENVEHLFGLETPAGTFSSPQAQGCSKQGGGMHNPYVGLRHGERVDDDRVNLGLQSSFVVIGTMVVLTPSMDDYEIFVNMLGEYDLTNPFGFKGCNSMIDEQVLVYFYLHRLKEAMGRSYPWSFVGVRYNAIFWNMGSWLEKAEMPPAVLHYFNTKPWDMKRREWPDLELWWTMVLDMIRSDEFTDEEKDELRELYRPGQLNLKPAENCFYCAALRAGKEAKHPFMAGEGKIDCPTYLEQLKAYRLDKIG